MVAKIIVVLFILIPRMAFVQDEPFPNICDYEGMHVRQLYRGVLKQHQAIQLHSTTLGWHHEYADDLVLRTNGYVVIIGTTGIAKRGHGNNRHKKAWRRMRHQRITSIDYFICSLDTPLFF
ncbi:MAG: hypothetical protein HUJ25_14925 [Crocinitomicaceae bacterium]|nr:hypothetical protein [Crocinitomicaceae bacterium]